MEYTQYYNLKKPELTDQVNIKDINENMDIVDEELKKIDEKSGLFPAITLPYAPLVEVPTNTVVTLTLEDDIEVTLGEPVEGYANEWDIIIPMPSPAVMLTLPEVSWGMGAAPTFSAGTTTIIRLYYIGATLCGEWASV